MDGPVTTEQSVDETGMTRHDALSLVARSDGLSSRIGNHRWFTNALITSAKHLNNLGLDASKRLCALLRDKASIMDKMQQLSEKLCSMTEKKEVEGFLGLFKGGGIAWQEKVNRLAAEL